MIRRGLILAALALVGCGGHSNTAEPGADDTVNKGEVALWATAPDGTKLWVVEGMGGRNVYFASAGAITSHLQNCGKNCVLTVDDVVPTLVNPVTGE